MAVYLLKRILLVIPTLFGSCCSSFIIIQFAPGGPVGAHDRELMDNRSSIVSRMGAVAATPWAAAHEQSARRRRR